MKNTFITTATAVLAFTVSPLWAAVSQEEAAKLGNELTPLGAEVAGNEEGTIPKWTGGYKQQIPGDEPGGRRGDPFKDEQKLYTVTADNMDEHADKLTDGIKEMLKTYPDTFFLNVYPTHRTAWAPEWVYENTAKNAVRAELDGHTPENIYGGIPFPIPQNGLEAMWNHKLAWRGTSWEVDLNQYQITSDGKVILANDATLKQRMPYYIEGGSPESFEDYYWELNLVTNGPPIRAGGMVVARSHIEAGQSASYRYLAGQRRVRRLPNTCCDTPAPSTAGLMSFDELSVFSGETDLFNWELLGKKEILVPYNQNGFLKVPESEIIEGNHLDPEHVRWELHRVWVVEATLREGERHQAPRSRYYLDEDTWNAMLGDRWDANGEFWKTMWQFTYVMPDIGGAVAQTFGYYDLLSGTAYVANVMNEKSFHHRPTELWDTFIFTKQGLMQQGVR